jgi:hypothetical protein
MDRRTFLLETTGAFCAAAGCAIYGVRSTERDGLAAAACCVVFDPTLEQSRALARCAARAGVDAWPVEDDIGMAWHTQLARRIGVRTRVVAALRPADVFVLTRLAAARGVFVLSPHDLLISRERGTRDFTPPMSSPLAS